MSSVRIRLGPFSLTQYGAVKVIVDTREKKPWEFDSAEVESGALETGDYSVEGVSGAIERKTADDFLNSITWDRDRFEKECRRASEFDEEMVIIVEEPWEYFANEEYYNDVHPNSIEGTVESWEECYNVRFQFEINRWVAQREAEEILREWESKNRNT